MKLLNKIQNAIQNNKIIQLILLFLLSIILFKDYLSMHYATDTYNVINAGYLEYAIHNSFVDGRIFAGALEVIANYINMPINVLVVGFTFIAIFISCIAVIVLRDMVLEIKETESKKIRLLITVISYITIFNFMYVENMYFIENLVMSISVLMYILSIRELVRKNKFYYLKAVVYAVIATFAYQGTISVFLLYGFVFSLITSKENFKKFTKNLALIFSIALISFALNVIQIKIISAIAGIDQQRLGGIEDILLQIKEVIICFKRMVLKDVIINTSGLFPKRLLIYFITAIMIVSMIYEAKYPKENIVLFLVQIIVVAIIISIAMCSINLLGYDTGRIHNEIGALLGMVLIFIYCCSDLFTKNVTISRILIIIFLIYFSLNCINTINILNQHKEVNKREKEFCQGLEEYIEEYEKENNKKVVEAKFYKNYDGDKVYFDGISNKSVITYNGVYCTWSSIGTINFYTNRKFERQMIEYDGENKEIIEKHMELKDQGYDNNFLIIDGILYYNVFV